MEVLSGTIDTVKFGVPSDLSDATFKVYKDNVQMDLGSATIENGIASVTIPYSAVQNDGQVDVSLLFDYQNTPYELKQTISVVTPILQMYEIKDILGQDSEVDVRTIESAVRHIIQAHTGQSFGKFVGTKSVTGGGESYLRLPMRLISLNSINDDAYWPQSVSLRGNGWYVVAKSYGVPSIKADFDGWHENPWGGPVTVPPYVSERFNFRLNQEYRINGTWGWESVPDAVREAAKLLVNDYACGDSIYRDRFVGSMTSADWKIQFHEGAFNSTGNVRANQLLQKFVLQRGWVVI